MDTQQPADPADTTDAPPVPDTPPTSGTGDQDTSTGGDTTAEQHTTVTDVPAGQLGEHDDVAAPADEQALVDDDATPLPSPYGDGTRQDVTR